jgi:UDP-hydrolysing UDP-N-acetyl-D-glucosamine 2-epimerase
LRKIGVVTTSRADFGIYRPLLKALGGEPALELALIVTGMHLAPEMGLSVAEIEAEGWDIAARVEMLLSSDSAQGAATSMGLGVMGLAQAYAGLRPDILVVLGDRLEMLAAAAAALPFNLPLAHLHGGELSLGAMDDAARHAITKLSHLHFVATDDYARRVAQMGEEPWRITVCGALGLDNLRQMTLLGKTELEAELGLSLDPAPLLVTFHPATREPGQAKAQMDQLLAALAQVGRPVVFTLPNADPEGRGLAAQVRGFAASHTHAHLRDNLGSLRYFSLMAVAAAMVGNSSSGIIEAPSLSLPVVNVGSRQDGRARGANVIDVGVAREEIVAGIGRACDPGLRAALAGAANPYDRGGAATIIVERLKAVELGARLAAKGFHDLPSGEQGL